MVTPGRKMRVGATTTIDNVCLRVDKITADGARIVTFDKGVDVYAGGSMPLPPYVNRPSDETDAARYQTIFAREPGAVAAPTAGLHFTSEILHEIPHTFVTLHVGPGTFLPVRSENIAEHQMHAERFFISPEAADKINKARRIVAVGTTAMRVLETTALETRLREKIAWQAHRLPWADGAPALQQSQTSSFNRLQLQPQSGETDLFIYPPFMFRLVDVLLTNFHLPRSTLLMLVSAFAGREFILRAYEEAVGEQYRFYSYGDCMLIL
jgi:S-adenosylmethionine:tRNA ribosyltransferase-isomerase